MTIDYNNGKIYTIRSHVEPGLIYVGSTCSPLHKRFYDHNKKYKLWLNNKYGNNTSFQIFKCGDAYIELHELFPCSIKAELLKREGEVIRSFDCVNRVVPGRSKNEYYKDKGTGNKKEYFLLNKDKIYAYQKNYKKATKECAICNCKVRRDVFKAHLKTTKHLANLAIASESNN